jgi:hypothetical protein
MGRFSVLRLVWYGFRVAIPAQDLTSGSFHADDGHLFADLFSKSKGVFPAIRCSPFSELIQEIRNECSGIAFWCRHVSVASVTVRFSGGSSIYAENAMIWNRRFHDRRL